MGKMQIEEFDEETEGEEDEQHGGGLGNGTSTPREFDQEKEPINAAGCPLFIEMASKTKNQVESLKVYKVDPPNEGFRGKMPKWADELYVAQKWGNGHFKIEAVNQVGRTLRSREIQLRVALEGGEALAKSTAPEPQTAENKFAELALRETNTNHRAEVDRIEKLARQVTDQTTNQSNKYLDMVTSQSLAASQRDREFFGTQGKQMENFFGAILAQTQQSHQNSVQMMREQFQQTMLMLQQGYIQQAQNNNPMAYIGVLMKGLEMGRGMDAEEPEEGWVKAITAGVDGLKSMVALKQQSPPVTMGMGMPTSTPLARAASGKELSRDQLREIVSVKRMADSKGVPFENLLAVAKDQLASLPNAQRQAELDDEEDEEEEDYDDDDEDLEDEEDLDEGAEGGQDNENAEAAPESPARNVSDEEPAKRRGADAGAVAPS